MSAEVNKTRIGAFVMGGLVLLVLGITLLGSRSFLSNNIEYVLYFDGSVSGLSIGAPVVFRGVPLGNVTKISLVANARDEGVTIPVRIRIDASAIVRLGPRGGLTDIMREEIIRRMVQRGLRARLQLQSLITGQYRVELDFFPDTAARYHSADHNTEIPTLPSPLDEFQRALTKLPLESIAVALREALEGIAKASNNPELYEAVTAIKGTFESANNLMAESSDLRDDTRRMINTINDTATTIDQQLPEAMAAFQLAMNSFAAAGSQLEKTLASADGIVSRDSRTVRDFNQLLKEVNDTARAVRGLANTLERNPEALLFGKGGKRP